MRWIRWKTSRRTNPAADDGGYAGCPNPGGFSYGGGCAEALACSVTERLVPQTLAGSATESAGSGTAARLVRVFARGLQTLAGSATTSASSATTSAGSATGGSRAATFRSAAGWCWLVVLAVLLSGCSTEETTASFPTRPIKLIVPFGPGGGTDTFARIIKKTVDDEALLPQPLVIINVAGAGATIGSRRVKNAKPDGYTLLILHEAIVTAKYAGKVNYGPEAFTPIAGTSELGLVVAVPEDSPFETLTELLEAARERPDELVFAANLSAPVHFVGLRLEKGFPGARFRFTQTGGGTNRLHALKGGHAEATVFSIEEYLRFEEAGLRALAYCDQTRHPALPNVPTTYEQGIELTHVNMLFWWAPEGTPPERVNVIANALEAAMATEQVQNRMAQIHSEPTFVRGESMQAEVRERQSYFEDLDMREGVELPNIPALVGVITLLLGIGTGVQMARKRAPTATARATGRFDLALVCLGLTLVYVTALGADLVEYRIATGVYIVSVGALLCGRHQGQRALLVVISIVAALGIHGILTGFFHLALP